jgi:hypothetical protein
MGRFKLLLALAIFILASVSIGLPAVADTSGCSSDSAFAGLCDPPSASGAINDGGVDLSAGYDSSSDGGRTNGGSDSPGADNGDGRAVVNGGAAGNIPNPLVFTRDGFIINCTPGSPCDPNVVVSVSDIATFRPAVPTLGMEPNGWTVVGLPTNFFASAITHVVSGSLLGFPADVRFTPVGYRWDYGDGATRTSPTGGASWAAQKLPEFSETPTSHIYQARGAHTISPAVVYSAEFRFAGQSWRGVRGTLVVPTPQLTAVAGDAKTVLVDRECSRNPSGPGC